MLGISASGRGGRYFVVRPTGLRNSNESSSQSVFSVLSRGAVPSPCGSGH